VAFYGNGGMNTNYRPGVRLHADRRRPDPDVPGAGLCPEAGSGQARAGHQPDPGLPALRGHGLAAFSPFSSEPANLTNNEHDGSLGFGARLGYQGQLTDWLTVGLSYQTPIAMSEFDSYAGLFAEQGDFDIPQNLTAGWR